MGNASVAGRVLAGDHPVADATVMILEGDAPHPDIAALTNETGTFELGGLEPGWYNLEARAGARTARRSVELGPDERAWVDMVLGA